MGAVLFTLCLLVSASLQSDRNEDIIMPGVKPKLDDTYLCMARKMNGSTPSYILGFNAHSDQNVAHHMLLYGCDTPGFENKVWDCGEMHTGESTGFDPAPICNVGPNILYAWALDAPSLHLPPDVAFKVGADTVINYLVLQVHYKHKPPKGHKDRSGITIRTSPTSRPKHAGVYLLATSGKIPAHSTVYMESACPMEQKITLHPFAFRAHTHKLGRVVSGYRIRDGQWTEIGRVNPRLPQMFYNVTNSNIPVSTGDILAARCTMQNEGEKVVNIGATQKDEMCNFYMMYWVDDGQLLNEPTCVSLGYPRFSWAASAIGNYMNLEAEPTDVSTRPDTGESYPPTVPKTRPSLLDVFGQFQNPRNDDDAYLARKPYYYYNDEY